ncbi:MAG: hypothetical protein WC755_04125 [Candidatus Woesearchaeota archaeon]|jgi:hypothetical protein
MNIRTKNIAFLLTTAAILTTQYFFQKEIDSMVDSILKKYLSQEWAEKVGEKLISTQIGETATTFFQNLNNSKLAKQGTVRFSVYDKDGLDKILINNNSLQNQNLTQIPATGFQNLYDHGVSIELKHLKEGRYIFTISYSDKKENVNSKEFTFDVKDPNGIGQETLYGSRGKIDNKFFPNGKEDIQL